MSEKLSFICFPSLYFSNNHIYRSATSKWKEPRTSTSVKLAATKVSSTASTPNLPESIGNFCLNYLIIIVTPHDESMNGVPLHSSWLLLGSWLLLLQKSALVLPTSELISRRCNWKLFTKSLRLSNMNLFINY